MQIENSAQLYICDSSQTYYAVLNNTSDPNFVGYINEITGFDSPEVRENASNKNAGDGGHHGPFWHGRRPFTISGMIMPTTPVLARSAAATKLDNVLNRCLRTDGYCVYTPSDGITRYMRFRKQQPQRITTGQSAVQKNFQIAGVSRDYLFYTTGAPHDVASTGTSPLLIVNNAGDAPAPARWYITGPIDQPYILDATTGKSIRFTNLPTGTIPSGTQVCVDFTTEYPAAYFTSNSASIYGYIDPLTTDYSIAVEPGTSQWQLLGSNLSGSTRFEMQWNDAWW